MNKGVKQCSRHAVAALSQALISISKPLKKRTGRELITRAPHYKL